jgi:hypothetical protein
MEIKEVLVVFAEIGAVFLISSRYIDNKFKEVEGRLSSFDSKYDKRCDELEAYVRRVEAVSEVSRRNGGVIQVIVKDDILKNRKPREKPHDANT